MKKPFCISGGSADIKKNYFVSIDNTNYGEAAGSVSYGPDDKTISNDLKKGIDLLRDKTKLTLSDLQDLMVLSINPVSKSALSAAVLHKISSDTNQYPWEILKLDEPGRIRTSYTVSIDTPENMLAEISNQPYPIIKLKMGFEDDEILAHQLSQVPGKVFRIDANGGWSLEKAERMIYDLSKCEVEIIEEPTAVENIYEWRHLKGKSKAKIFIDEGLNYLEDYYKYADYVDGINVKISKSGGVIGAVDIVKQASHDKIPVMLGCMVESGIGISQAIYLSSLAEYFDLDGPLLLKETLCSGINFNIENISIDQNIIGGPRIKKEFIDE